MHVSFTAIIALRPFDPAHYVIADNSFTLSCVVINISPQSNGIITFEWSKDNSKIDNTNQTIEISSINTGTSQLKIEKLNPNLHNGEYSCRAIYNNTSSNSASKSTNVIIESKFISYSLTA